MTINEVDTIVAIATPAGEGGVGIIRISGPKATMIGERVFVPRRKKETPWSSHELLYGRVVDAADGSVIDDGLATRMAAPNSYTGEDVVEFHLHGSPVTLGQTVNRCRALGARLAEPGEFTRRAFLHGKMDLVQAEAVAELIRARSEAEATSARRRISGRLSDVFHQLREEMIALLAEVEADVDFPEENLPLPSQPQKAEKLHKIQLLMKNLRTSYAANQRLFGGFSVVLIGKPNVGKSALFNALLNVDRAIVTSVPGTTRDTLREELILQGRRVRFTDTAGLRPNAEDEVEQLGIDRTERESGAADLLLLVTDATTRLGIDEERLMKRGEKDGPPVWLIRNKVDLGAVGSNARQMRELFEVSALRGDGVERLREEIGKIAKTRVEVSAEGGISNDRQLALVDKGLEALDRGKAEWTKGASPEFVAFELRQAYQALSRIVGKDEGIEDILDDIFSRFCIGK